jgi:hypothetical protein
MNRNEVEQLSNKQQRDHRHMFGCMIRCDAESLVYKFVLDETLHGFWLIAMLA